MGASSVRSSDVRLGERFVKVENAGANRGKIDLFEGLFARSVLHRRYSEERGDRHRGAVEVIQGVRHGRAQIFNRRLARQAALDLGARHRERRSEVVRDVVADALQLIEKPVDLVEHQVDGARDLVDVVAFAGFRQTRAEVAVHDVGDLVVDSRQPSRTAAGEKQADGEDQQDRRRERDGERARNGLAQRIDLQQAPSEQQHASVGPPAGDENRRIGFCRSSPARGIRGRDALGRRPRSPASSARCRTPGRPFASNSAT